MKWISAKLDRIVGALKLCMIYAADIQTRRTLLHIYSNLSRHELYDDEVFVNFRVGKQVFPFYMRISDIFIVLEILHEQQYRLQHPIPTRGTIIDLGGNIGASMMWFLGQHPEADYHVFEPAQDNLHFLRRNVQPWPHIHLQEVAVGDKTGSIDLFHGEFGGMHSTIAVPEDPGCNFETVPVITMADYLETHKITRVDLLKIDVEGAEQVIIDGFGPKIKRVQTIIGEVHDNIIDTKRFYETLRGAGFSRIKRNSFREGADLGVHGFEASRT
ncbi:FkbM family methyltransferase [Roseovarius aestuarii]|uniref:2-O-methyltransferase NoeI n=1 Tax=Roseovarius aestuarii TaxID=475083 RepID=A0A1X7BTN4_9RHOB|nr:FkbM family methyltransferase [Roseovarius aestuarii]SMC12982.1 2-O-methyltransferase NoeI [Roseovarius aestuarii]